MSLLLPSVLPPEHGDERAEVEPGLEEVPPLDVPSLSVVGVAGVVHVVELDVLLVPERPQAVDHEARVDREVKAVKMDCKKGTKGCGIIHLPMFLKADELGRLVLPLAEFEPLPHFLVGDARLQYRLHRGGFRVDFAS